MTKKERRMQKYPDTETFCYFNANPKGRLGGDCAVRAISTALNQSWEQTVRDLTEVSLKTGYILDDPHCYGKYLKDKGWVKMPQPRKADNTKYTGEEWCWLLRESKKAPQQIIAHLGGGHIVAIMSTVVCDTWDSTGGCIGNYWVRG